MRAHVRRNAPWLLVIILGALFNWFWWIDAALRPAVTTCHSKTEVLDIAGLRRTDFTPGEALFDLTSTESAQVIELYTNYIDDASEGARALHVMKMQSILRAVERGIPQQLVPDLKVWLYAELGITTEDDR